MLWLISIGTLSFALLIVFFSYFYQKSFSTLNKTSNILITSLAFILLSVFLLFALFYFDINSIHSNFFKNKINYPLFFLVAVNTIFYVIIPFCYFLFQQKGSTNEEGKYVLLIYRILVLNRVPALLLLLGSLLLPEHNVPCLLQNIQ